MSEPAVAIGQTTAEKFDELSVRICAHEAVEEWKRAKAKHGDQTPDGPCLPERLSGFLDLFPVESINRDLASEVVSAYANLRRLATLTEEIGEVGRCLTYDQDHAGELKKELIQVAAMALAWASRL